MKLQKSTKLGEEGVRIRICGNRQKLTEMFVHQWWCKEFDSSWFSQRLALDALKIHLKATERSEK